MEWKNLIERYFEERETLKLCCLILDARRGWMANDLDLKRWLEYQGRPYLVIATKFDKLNQSEQERGMRANSRLPGDRVEPLQKPLGVPGVLGEQLKERLAFEAQFQTQFPLL